MPVALALGLFVASLARDWRWTTNHFPLDPAPAADLLGVVLIGGAAMLSGLVLLVSRRAVIGAWLFVLGVALSCGAAIGFFIGPPVP